MICFLETCRTATLLQTVRKSRLEQKHTLAHGLAIEQLIGLYRRTAGFGYAWADGLDHAAGFMSPADRGVMLAITSVPPPYLFLPRKPNR